MHVFKITILSLLSFNKHPPRQYQSYQRIYSCIFCHFKQQKAKKSSRYKHAENKAVAGRMMLIPNVNLLRKFDIYLSILIEGK